MINLLPPDRGVTVKLKMNKDNIYYPDVQNKVVSNPNELLRALRLGFAGRTTSKTGMNDTSSRSHCLFTIQLTFGERKGRLNIVDLAGSENANAAVNDTNKKEASEINRSLLNLGRVLRAIVDKDKFIPFTGSVLTKLLKSSLGGNSKTLMISTVSPSDSNLQQTLSTLNYSIIAKQVVNKPTIHRDPKDMIITELHSKIAKLLNHMMENGVDVDLSSIDFLIRDNHYGFLPSVKQLQDAKEKRQRKKDIEAGIIVPGEEIKDGNQGVPTQDGIDIAPVNNNQYNISEAQRRLEGVSRDLTTTKKRIEDAHKEEKDNEGKWDTLKLDEELKINCCAKEIQKLNKTKCQLEKELQKGSKYDMELDKLIFCEQLSKHMFGSQVKSKFQYLKKDRKIIINEKNQNEFLRSLCQKQIITSHTHNIFNKKMYKIIGVKFVEGTVSQSANVDLKKPQEGNLL